jgi:hypothetical protein
MAIEQEETLHTLATLIKVELFILSEYNRRDMDARERPGDETTEYLAEAHTALQNIREVIYEGRLSNTGAK